MIIQSVGADNGNREGKWIALLILLIAMGSALIFPLHQAVSTPGQLADYQISIKVLAPQELTMIADLRLAHEEIHNLYQDRVDSGQRGAWADISELETLWLPPFIRDKSWLRQGKHHWHKIAPAAYQGVPTLSSGSSAALLISNQSEPDIWLDLNRRGQTFPALSRDAKQNTSDRRLSGGFPAKPLIAAGWKQVIFAAPR